ncbi:MAG TPA: IPT/TIG domain-containing protein [Bryobacteraceae bacterium]
MLQGPDGAFYGITALPGNSNGAVFRLNLNGGTGSGTGSGSSPVISPTPGIVGGASFQPGIAPDSWITINGTNLSTVTDTWANAVVNGNLPVSLDGVSVSVGSQPAYIAYVSPTQINALAPNVGTGTVAVTVTNSSGTSSPITTVAQAFQPAFFQWGSYAVATTPDWCRR